ncbi:MAG: bifunctional DNA-formamidopyrimidine glycosylase/DNA-(apurinic or apyrimidinic site) lyase, partial [Methyloceanibacter sp.]
KNFGKRLSGKGIEALDRRAKYLLARLDDGEVLVMHLGMTGRFRIDRSNTLEPSSPLLPLKGGASPKPKRVPKHEHIVFHLRDGTAVRYSDTRRFGLMDLIPARTLDDHALFKGLGPEPFDDAFTPEWLAQRLKGKATTIKAALIDQRLIAGIGNIYACEALFRARISPLTLAGTLATKSGKPTMKAETLVEAVKAVLETAIQAGGSSLRDYRRADGRLGRFQHRFNVYRREGKPCRRKGCGGKVRRIVQSGRSTFYCPTCQR